jgi:hypothetical protein
MKANDAIISGATYRGGPPAFQIVHAKDGEHLVGNSALLLRAQDVTTMIERPIEIGKRVAAQQQQR